LPVYAFHARTRKIPQAGLTMPGMYFMSNPDAVGRARGFDLRRFALGALVLFIGFACLAILRPFLASITWAAILAYGSWP
jgi:hypothetical protein